jgi:hypothetical protein
MTRWPRACNHMKRDNKSKSQLANCSSAAYITVNGRSSIMAVMELRRRGGKLQRGPGGGRQGRHRARPSCSTAPLQLPRTPGSSHYGSCHCSPTHRTAPQPGAALPPLAPPPALRAPAQCHPQHPSRAAPGTPPSQSPPPGHGHSATLTPPHLDLHTPSPHTPALTPSPSPSPSSPTSLTNLQKPKKHRATRLNLKFSPCSLIPVALTSSSIRYAAVNEQFDQTFHNLAEIIMPMRA